MRTILAGLAVVVLAAPPAAAQEGRGRFLYANDDDWDWASPLGGPRRSGLAVYGEMEWSALDWAEEGLAEVRGVLVGTWPSGYLTAEDFAGIRSSGYATAEHIPGGIARLLEGRNVAILMRDGSGDFEIGLAAGDVEALVAFVERGGRLVVLDDWGGYRPVLDGVLVCRVEPPRPAADLRERALALVERLGSAEYAQREEATDALVELGPAVLPILAGVSSGDAEVANRLAWIRSRLTSPRTAVGPGTSLEDEELEECLPAARRIAPRASVRATRRNGGQEPGRALLIPLGE